MKIEHVLGTAALLLVAACASPGAETSKTSEAAISEEGEALTYEVYDLDGDGVNEQWTTRADLCGTGGCTYTIHLSTRPGETFGEVFGKEFGPRGPRMDPNAPPDDFVAEARGGYCNYALNRMAFNVETQQYEEKSSIDCHAVINRIGGRVAQYEYRCFDLIPAEECKDIPVADPLAPGAPEPEAP